MGNALYPTSFLLLNRIDKITNRAGRALQAYTRSGFVQYLCSKPIAVIFHENDFKWLTTHPFFFAGEVQIRTLFGTYQAIMTTLRAIEYRVVLFSATYKPYTLRAKLLKHMFCFKLDPYEGTHVFQGLSDDGP